jgi:hypothetical protein
MFEFCEEVREKGGEGERERRKESVSDTYVERAQSQSRWQKFTSTRAVSRIDVKWKKKIGSSG